MIYESFYGIGKEKLTLNASQTQEYEFKSPADVPFKIQELQVTSNNVNGIAVNFGCKIRDNTGRYYTEGYINTNYFSNSGSGHAERHIDMNIIVPPNTVFLIELKNYDDVNVVGFSLDIIGKRIMTEWPSTMKNVFKKLGMFQDRK